MQNDVWEVCIPGVHESLHSNVLSAMLKYWSVRITTAVANYVK